MCKDQQGHGDIARQVDVFEDRGVPSGEVDCLLLPVKEIASTAVALLVELTDSQESQTLLHNLHMTLIC